MNDYQSLKHTKYECKFHIVFIPKYRKKVIYGQLRKELGAIFHELARQKESKIEEGYLMIDHVHMLLSMPPKYSLSQVVGFTKGKSSIWIARNYMSSKRHFCGQHFWAKGYFVSTVGRDENLIREYIRDQEKTGRRNDQLEIFE